MKTAVVAVVSFLSGWMFFLWLELMHEEEMKREREASAVGS